MPQDFLIEIGVEDMPPHAVDALCAQFENHLAEALESARLGVEALEIYIAPRRLVAWGKALDDAQPERTLEVKGPPKNVAFDAQGRPTKAAQGFCRGQGVDVAEAYVKQADGGEYLFLSLLEEGQPAAQVLAQIVPQALARFTPMETMRWGVGVRFVRPVRWLLALCGDTVVPFEWAGVRASNTTWGHRFSSRQQITVKNPDDYFEQMAAHHVMVRQTARRAHIVSQLQEAAQAWQARCEPTDKSMHQLVHSGEYPSAVPGSFNERFLSLPAEVLSTTMINHQRFVPCYHQETGNILPHFVGFRDGLPQNNEQVRRGYEWVLEARLADSEFFFMEDRRRALAEYVPDLKAVIYQAKLGSVWDKTDRMRAYAHFVGKQLGWRAEQRDKLDRAVYLSKADLVTLMVGEFPELQGVMGRVYGELDGEAPDVTQAIGEHYLPQGSQDPLPASDLGLLLSLIDKLDTVVGSFLIGEKPTGSRDPFGLRRAANAIVRMVLQRELDLDLYALIQEQQGLYDFLEVRCSLDEVEAFFNERLVQVLRTELGVAYDIAEAVTAPGDGNFLNVLQKARSLESLRASEDFESLVLAFNRANNILKKKADEVPPSYDAKGLVDEAERDLWRALLKAESRIEKHLLARDFAGVLAQLVALRPAIDRFFDEVLVMAKDEALRRNRLGFLNAVVETFMLVADLSHIVIEGRQPVS